MSWIDTILKNFTELRTSAIVVAGGVGTFVIWVSQNGGLKKLRFRLDEIEKSNKELAKKLVLKGISAQTDPDADPDSQVKSLVEGLDLWHSASDRLVRLNQNMASTWRVTPWWFLTSILTYLSPYQTMLPEAGVYLLMAWVSELIFMVWQVRPVIMTLVEHGADNKILPGGIPDGTQAINSKPGIPSISQASTLDLKENAVESLIGQKK